MFASIANYLAKAGWNDRHTWGRKVMPPPSLGGELLGLDNQKSLPEWQALGVRRSNGADLPYVALDRQDRLIVSKLAALLRVANALDAEHLQKVQHLRLRREDRTWVLEIEGSGDLTMEQLAASARADLFSQMFGRELVFQPVMVRT